MMYQLYVSFQGVAVRLRSMRLDFNRTSAQAQGFGLSSNVTVCVSGSKLKRKQLFAGVVEDQTDYNGPLQAVQRSRQHSSSHMQREDATRLEVVFDEKSCGELADEVLLQFRTDKFDAGIQPVEFMVRHHQPLTIHLHLLPKSSIFHHCTRHFWSLVRFTVLSSSATSRSPDRQLLINLKRSGCLQLWPSLRLRLNI
jgi:hypothetical protein